MALCESASFINYQNMYVSLFWGETKGSGVPLWADKQMGEKQTKRSRNQAEGVTQTQSILHELSVELRKPWKQKQHSQLRFTAQGPVLFIFNLQNQPCYYSCSGRSWLVKYSVWEGWRKLFEFHHNKVHSKVTKVLFLHANTWPLSNSLISL